MVKIAFHDNCLCERGTTIAVYDYAYYNRKLLNNESVILYFGNDLRNVPEVLQKFKKEFKLIPYNNWNDVDDILEKENIDILYMIKAGEWDGKISNKIKTVVHCVFNTDYKHGLVYATIAPWVNGNNNKYPYVPHMINLLDHNETMHEELKIPKNSIIFGRHGGFKQFDIPFVHNCVYNFAKNNPDIYFIFVNTEVFCHKLDNIIHIDKIIDLYNKTKFINTCDAMIWGRSDGEIYSLSQGEFSSKNKPIICMNTGYNGHVYKLKENALWYNNEIELYNILNNFNKDDIKKKDWNMYKDSTPEQVMEIFNNVFIKPCLLN